jgi:3-hydroxyisobutyrate dehydrogenase-like beta-hydroxyacid dehydrogenase
MTRITYLGTGLLGSGIVESMLRRGLPVTVWNRTASKARALEPLGATVADAPEAAVAAADEIHMTLSDDAAVDAMLDRIAPHVRASATVIDHTTTSPAGTKARLERAAARGMRLLHAPVFMSPQAARESGGLMLVSGPSSIFEAVRSSLTPMAADLWYLGEREDLAAAYKMFGNSMLFAMTAGVADILAMARNLSIAPADAVSVFDRFNAGGALGMRAKKMARADLSASFELTMARKDIGLMLEAAGAEPLAALPAIARRMDDAIEHGHGKHDLGAIAAAGLPSSK